MRFRIYERSSWSHISSRYAKLEFAQINWLWQRKERDLFHPNAYLRAIFPARNSRVRKDSWVLMHPWILTSVYWPYFTLFSVRSFPALTCPKYPCITSISSILKELKAVQRTAYICSTHYMGPMPLLTSEYHFSKSLWSSKSRLLPNPQPRNYYRRRLPMMRLLAAIVLFTHCTSSPDLCCKSPPYATPAIAKVVDSTLKVGSSRR